MEEQHVSRAYSAGTPTADRSQTISPRAVWRSTTKSSAFRTTGHIARAKSSSRVTSSSCHTPTATYAAWLLSPFFSTASPRTVFIGHEPSSRWCRTSQS